MTAFNNLAKYTRRPPSRATSTEDVLSFLAHWMFIIRTDTTKQFYQLPLDRNSIQASPLPSKGCGCTLGLL